LEFALSDAHVFPPVGAYWIGADFGGDCQGSVEAFRCIKPLLDACYARSGAGVRLDIGSGSVPIPTDSHRMLVLCSAVQSLRIPGRTEVIRANDFVFA
jgi:hypothetical protein